MKDGVSVSTAWEVRYDAAVGVEPVRRTTDRERQTALLDQHGLDNLPESAYRDLEQLD